MYGFRSLALTVTIAALGLACCSDASSQENISPAQKRAELAEAIVANPVSGSARRALKTYFPKEFDQFVAKLVEVEATTGDMNLAARVASAELDLSLRAYESDITAAPTPEMWTMIEARTELLKVLQKESALACVAFGTGKPMSDSAQAAYSPEATLKTWQESAAYFTALAGGRDHPQKRSAPTAESQKEFNAAIVKRFGPPPSESDRRNPSPEISCALKLAHYNALHDIPKEDAATILAQTMTAQVAKKSPSDQVTSPR